MRVHARQRQRDNDNQQQQLAIRSCLRTTRSLKCANVESCLFMAEPAATHLKDRASATMTQDELKAETKEEEEAFDALAEEAKEFAKVRLVIVVYKL